MLDWHSCQICYHIEIKVIIIIIYILIPVVATMPYTHGGQ